VDVHTSRLFCEVRESERVCDKLSLLLSRSALITCNMEGVLVGGQLAMAFCLSVCRDVLPPFPGIPFPPLLPASSSRKIQGITHRLQGNGFSAVTLLPFDTASRSDSVEVHYRIHKRPPRVPVLSQINPEGSCAFLDYYAACSTNSFLSFRDNLSVPSSSVKNPDSLPKKYHYSLHNIPEECSSHVLRG
jgi:hypothetical protein